MSFFVQSKAGKRSRSINKTREMKFCNDALQHAAYRMGKPEAL